MTDQPIEVWILIFGVVFLAYGVFFLAAQLRTQRAENVRLRVLSGALMDGAIDDLNDVQIVGGREAVNRQFKAVSDSDWLTAHPSVEEQRQAQIEKGLV